MADIFSFRSNFAFSLGGEASVIAKGTPNLRKTHVKKNNNNKKNPLYLLSTPSQANCPLEIIATSLKAAEVSFVNVKGEIRGLVSKIIFPGEV